MIRKKSIYVAVAALFASTAFSVGSGAHVSAVAAAGENGLLPIQNGGDCVGSGGVDATTADWNWTKPTLEVSTDTGATFTSAAGNTTYGAMVCRGVGMNGSSPSYWFIVMGPGGNDDMGTNATAANILFRVTVPMKSGDSALRLMGYSRVSSFKVEPTKITAIVGASGVSKINTNPRETFFSRHSECDSAAGVDRAMGQCNFQKADRDIQGMVIQHITYTNSTPSSFQTLTQGVWIGANVSGFNLNISCGSNGNDNNGTGGGSGGNYSGNDKNDGGANAPASTAGSLEVSMSGTPHLRQDGTTNSGNLQAFVPETAARKCFGDGTDTVPLADIAKAVSVERSESTEGTTNVTAFTASAVTSPVAGLMIDVPNMTFSNPTYKVKSSLSKGSSTAAKSMKKGRSATLKSLIKPTSGAKKVKYTVSGSCSISGSKLVAKKKGTCTLKMQQTVKGKKSTKTQKITVS